MKDMNIFNKVTAQALKRNRTRTIVTIIGVILSTSMFTAVTSTITSVQNYLIESTKAMEGDWHVKFTDVDYDFLQEARGDSELSHVAVTRDVGYALLDGGYNSEKPYLFISGFDESAFGTLPIRMMSGRLPQNDGEVIVPEHVESNGGIAYQLGDRMELAIGKRSYDGETLDQSDAYRDASAEGGEKEALTTETMKTYTVVGFYERPGFEVYSSPGYTMVTKIDANSAAPGDTFGVYATLRSPHAFYQYMEKFSAGKYADAGLKYTPNTELLRYMGISDSDTFNSLLYSFGGILIGLIMVGSILLIYNSFAISVSERSRQFGILSSVGATKKQLRKSVRFEGLCIALIGIPIGLLTGIIGIGITLRFVGDIFREMSVSNLPLTLHLSIPALAVAAAIALVTILISAHIPARRAVKKSAIDTIRQAGDVKIKARSVKTSRLTSRLFGLEGTLAIKNFKRNRKRYRSTIISLFVSIVLFISASAFGMYLQDTAMEGLTDVGFDIMLTDRAQKHAADEEVIEAYHQLRQVEGVTEGAYLNELTCSGTIPKEAFEEGQLKGAEYENGSAEDVSYYIGIFFFDDDTYRGYLGDLGLSPEDYDPADGNMLAIAQGTAYDEKRKVETTANIFKESSLTVPIAPGARPEEWTSPTRDITFTFVDEAPEELTASHGFWGIAPYSAKHLFPASDELFSGVTMTFSSDDPYASSDAMEAITSDSSAMKSYVLDNLAEMLDVHRNILLIIDVFTFGFVILISLITIANVFNTISTSIGLRRREFAMLRSVGMGDRSFNRMMNVECAFYGVKALLYGLPISTAITYLLYHSVVDTGMDVHFRLPWASVGVSVLSVFIIVFVTMLYSVGKVKKANVIDALRDDVT